MGHRALVAYRHAGDRHDLHRSQWGGADFALLEHLSAATPYALDTPYAVDPEPVATAVSIPEIVDHHLDFLRHEAFYRVDRDCEPTAFHVCWFGLELDAESVARSETVGHGALVEVVPGTADYVRGWFRGTKAVVGDLVDRGTLTRREATDLLAARIEAWSGDREVVDPP